MKPNSNQNQKQQGKAQTPPTADREKVRELTHPVRAPRQSQRPVERNSKGKG